MDTTNQDNNRDTSNSVGVKSPFLIDSNSQVFSSGITLQEIRKRQSIANLGRPLSEEHKKRLEKMLEKVN